MEYETSNQERRLNRSHNNRNKHSLAPKKLNHQYVRRVSVMPESALDNQALLEADGPAEMEHLVFGQMVVTFEIGRGISGQQREEFTNRMLGFGPSQPPFLDGLELEFVDAPVNYFPESPEPRLLCRSVDCTETKVFQSMEDVRESEWTEVVKPAGLLKDMTELYKALCPTHARSKDEGYEPENDLASPEWWRLEV